MTRRSLIAAVASLALAGGAFAFAQNAQRKSYDAPPKMAIDPKKDYTATIETSLGTIKIDLFEKDAPVTVNNFVVLSRDHFYDGVIFHRVIPNFMIQGGDPTGTGTGDAGYKFDDEPGALQLQHDGPGVLSMANAGPNTNGCQFFITQRATPHLNGRHAVFGKVTEGQDVVDKIANAPRDRRDKPTTDVVIKSITIEEK
jgi:peptidyl-prolyl cis-trans isomerase B (cyclophilin B)